MLDHHAATATRNCLNDSHSGGVKRGGGFTYGGHGLIRLSRYIHNHPAACFLDPNRQFCQRKIYRWHIHQAGMILDCLASNPFGSHSAKDHVIGNAIFLAMRCNFGCQRCLAATTRANHAYQACFKQILCMRAYKLACQFMHEAKPCLFIGLTFVCMLQFVYNVC